MMKSERPRRVRFCHAKIDSDNLKSGKSYHELKNVVIILITPYDLFALNRMVYTIQNKCVEETTEANASNEELKEIQSM